MMINATVLQQVAAGVLKDFTLLSDLGRQLFRSPNLVCFAFEAKPISFVLPLLTHSISRQPQHVS